MCCPVSSAIAGPPGDECCRGKEHCGTTRVYAISVSEAHKNRLRESVSGSCTDRSRALDQPARGIQEPAFSVPWIAEPQRQPVAFQDLTETEFERTIR